LVGGPVLGAIAAGALNYISKENTKEVSVCVCVCERERECEELVGVTTNNNNYCSTTQRSPTPSTP